MTALYWLKVIYNRFPKNPFILLVASMGQQSLFIYVSHVVLVSVLYGKIIKDVTDDTGLFPACPFFRYYVYSVVISVCLYYVLYKIALFLKNKPFAFILGISNK